MLTGEHVHIDIKNSWIPLEDLVYHIKILSVEYIDVSNAATVISLNNDWPYITRVEATYHVNGQ